MKSIKTVILLTFLSGMFIAVSAEKRYYKANLHCHTTNSDGGGSPEFVCESYYNNGYEILGISDHDTLTLDPGCGIFTIPNEETSGWQHILAIGTEEVVPIMGSFFNIDQQIIKDPPYNALPVLCHPSFEKEYAGWYPAIMNIPQDDYVAMEVIQPLDWLEEDAWFWDTLLSQGRQVYGFGSDDWHDNSTFGPLVPPGGKLDEDRSPYGWVMILLDTLTREAVMEALWAGDFYPTCGPSINHIIKNGRTLEVQSEDGVTITFIGHLGDTLASFDSSAAQYTLPGTNDTYVRAVVEDNQGSVAYTQPYFPERAVAKKQRAKLNVVPHIFYTHPNPFNVSTAISFQLPAVSQVCLDVYNTIGKPVKTLVNGRKEPGVHSVMWDAQGLPCGIYLVKLVQGSEVFTKKIMLMK